MKDSQAIAEAFHEMLQALDVEAALPKLQAGTAIATASILAALTVEVCKLREAIEAKR